MNATDHFEVRQAPGWWPSLVIVTCTRCGAESGTVDLNNSAQATFTGRPRWTLTHVCGGES